MEVPESNIIVERLMSVFLHHHLTSFQQVEKSGHSIEHSRTTEICQKTCSNFTYTQVSEVQNYFVVGLVPGGLGTSVLNIVSNFVFEKILF